MRATGLHAWCTPIVRSGEAKYSGDTASDNTLSHDEYCGGGCRGTGSIPRDGIFGGAPGAGFKTTRRGGLFVGLRHISPLATKPPPPRSRTPDPTLPSPI